MVKGLAGCELLSGAKMVPLLCRAATNTGFREHVVLFSCLSRAFGDYPSYPTDGASILNFRLGSKC